MRGAWLAALGACAGPDRPAPTVPSSAFVLPARVDRDWPSAAVVLDPPPLTIPDGFGRPVVTVDAGHGTGENQGAISSFGVEESVHTLRASDHLARWLEGTGAFRVALARTDRDGPSYDTRIARAEAARARALISLHADARGAVTAWSPRPGETWRLATSSPGVAILWSARGALGPERQRLARALALQLARAGFLPYDGADYTGLYEPDPEVPGVFRDLRGLRMLGRPSVPSVIVETHNALDPHEVRRWEDDPATLDAFAAAVAAGLVDFLRP